MPHGAAVRQADIFSAFPLGRYHQDIGIAGQDRIVGRVMVERAEPLGKIDLLLRCQVLVAKHQDEMLQMRPVHLGEGFGVEGFAQVEANHLGAQRVGKGTNFEGHGLSL